MTSDHLPLSRSIQVFLLFRQSEGLSDRTIEFDEYALRILQEYLCDPPVDSIQPDDLRTFIRYLGTEYKPTRMGGDASPLSPASVKRIWNTLRAFFRWTREEFSLERPDLNMPKPKFKSPVVMPFTKDEVNKLLKASRVTKVDNPARGSPYTMRRRTGK
ncbi:MAG: phage integrase N-terminal SAM-like domain-containing protein, partial [Anaerolineales bacterium]|nr:phage integrase N-terminal SAM-like domain-containing protein [Anaerolineales bacterium]